MKKLKIKIDLNVLNHLGAGLYSSTPAVLTEIVANAWDADATRVDIDINPDGHSILIRDNGHGMSVEDLQTKFLTVGYARRLKEGTDRTQGLNRPVMGRKGIGKLALFSLANRVEIASRRADTSAVGGTINVIDLRKSIEAESAYELEQPMQEFLDAIIDVHGTRIRLSTLTRDVKNAGPFLISRIARRFAVIGSLSQFEVHVNGTSISKLDQGFHGDLQFLWTFDEQDRQELLGLSPNLATLEGQKCESILDNMVSMAPPTAIRGYIASVLKPKQLRRLDANLNQIAIFARGRVFQEDILTELGNSKVFNNYLVGEIHADYLDDGEVDRAVASREAVRHDDPAYSVLSGFVAKRLSEIEGAWDDWRRKLGYEKAEDVDPVVADWLNGLTKGAERKLADRLVTSIGNTRLSQDDNDDQAQKRLLYRSAIVGFEKLRARQMLHELDEIDDVLSPEFQAIFARLADVEETYYHDITSSRLQVISKFEEIVDANSLEKVAQQYLFENLWLLDPSWGRVSGTETMEVTLTEYLKKAVPEEMEGARLDIAFRRTGGKFVIIELKRPGKPVPFPALLEQIRRYKIGIEQYFKDHPDVSGFGGRAPIIDAYLLVDHAPTMIEADHQSLRAYNAAIITYKGLIDNAKSAYEQYLDVHKKTSRIESIVSRLGGPGAT